MPTTALTVFVIITSLPPGLRPAYVSRRGLRTFIYAQSDALFHEGILWSTQFLSVAERNYVRRAISQPPIGEAIDPALMELPIGVLLDVPGLRPPVPQQSLRAVR